MIVLIIKLLLAPVFRMIFFTNNLIPSQTVKLLLSMSLSDLFLSADFDREDGVSTSF